MARRCLVAVLLTMLALTLVGHAAATTPKPKPGWPVTIGERGTRVCGVLNLLHAYRPSHFRKPWFRVLTGPIPAKDVNCVFTNKAAKKATPKLKLLLGYRSTELDPSFGRNLYRILLTGKTPQGYSTRASRRVIREKSALAEAKREANWGDRLVTVAFRDLGCCPESDNRDGPRLRQMQALTHSYGAPWCVTAEQFWRVQAGWHTIADNSAGVYNVVAWAKRHALISRIPRRGYLAAYSYAHMELVYRVTSTHFYTIGGNTSGNVTTRYYRHGSRPVVFIAAGPTAPRS